MGNAVFSRLDHNDSLGEIFTLLLQRVTDISLRVSMQITFTMFMNIWFLGILENKDCSKKRKQIIQSVSNFTSKGIYGKKLNEGYANRKKLD